MKRNEESLAGRRDIESLQDGYDAYLEIVSLVKAGGGTKEQKEKVAQIIEQRNERSRRIQKATTDTLNNFAKLLVDNETVVWHNATWSIFQTMMKSQLQ